MREKYIDQSGDKKYFSLIPHYITNHASHYEQSLYLVMKRVTGENGTCWASPAKLGKMMGGVSANTVRKYRDKLIKRGWIRKIGQRGKTKPTDEFEIVDLWKLNVDFYAQKESSTSEQSPKKLKKIVQPVTLDCSTGGNKEEPMKKNPIYNIKSDKKKKIEKYQIDALWVEATKTFGKTWTSGNMSFLMKLVSESDVDNVKCQLGRARESKTKIDQPNAWLRTMVKK